MASKDKSHVQFPDGPLGVSLAILDALGEAGMVIVSIEPSRERLEAIARVGGVDMSKAAAIYQEVLRADN